MKSNTLYGFASSPTYTHIRAGLAFGLGLNIGRTVSSVATTCDSLTRSAIPLIQRLNHIRDIPAPYGLRGPGNLKALPLENIFQSIQWEVIRTPFTGHDKSQQSGAGKAFFDGRIRFGSYFDLRVLAGTFATGARILLLRTCSRRSEVSRDVFDLPALLAADLFALHTATRAGPLFGAQLIYVGVDRKILEVR